MARWLVVAVVGCVLGIMGCGGSDSPGGSGTGTAGNGGGSPPPGTCAKGTGAYTWHCLSVQCSDGSGSCADNDPVDVQIILQGDGLTLISPWVVDQNSFTADGCDQSIVAHQTNTINNTNQTTHETVICNASGTSCQVMSTDSIQTATAQGTCVENATFTKG
jgi:hypothetical protein